MSDWIGCVDKKKKISDLWIGIKSCCKWFANHIEVTNALEKLKHWSCAQKGVEKMPKEISTVRGKTREILYYIKTLEYILTTWNTYLFIHPALHQTGCWSWCCTWRISYRVFAMTFPPALLLNFGSLRISFGGFCGSSLAFFAGAISSIWLKDWKCFSFATSFSGGSSVAFPPKKYKSRKTPKHTALATILQWILMVKKCSVRLEMI